MLGNAARVRLTRDVDLAPHTVLKEGETGLVVRSEADALGVYMVEVLMDRHHKGLDEWDNRALLVPPELDALEELSGSSLSTISSHITTIAAGIAAVAGGLIGKFT